MATPHGWRTAIAYADHDNIVLRGHSLLEMIGKTSFAEAFLLAATGRRASAGEVAVLDAIMVAVIDHGIVPSSIITRYLASCGNAVQTAVAGGVMAFGDTYGGAAQQLAELLHHCVGEKDLEGQAAAEWILDRCAARGGPVPGYGHPLHPNGDPRTTALLQVARQHGVAARFVDAAVAVQEQLGRRKGRPILLNGDGVIGALALDLGFDWRLVRALIFVPRAAGLAVHAVEEMTREKGWRTVSDDDIHYDGTVLEEVLP